MDKAQGEKAKRGTTLCETRTAVGEILPYRESRDVHTVVRSVVHANRAFYLAVHGSAAFRGTHDI